MKNYKLKTFLLLITIVFVLSNLLFYMNSFISNAKLEFYKKDSLILILILICIIVICLLSLINYIRLNKLYKIFISFAKNTNEKLNEIEEILIDAEDNIINSSRDTQNLIMEIRKIIKNFNNINKEAIDNAEKNELKKNS